MKIRIDSETKLRVDPLRNTTEIGSTILVPEMLIEISKTISALANDGLPEFNNVPVDILNIKVKKGELEKDINRIQLINTLKLLAEKKNDKDLTEALSVCDIYYSFQEEDIIIRFFKSQFNTTKNLRLLIKSICRIVDHLEHTLIQTDKWSKKGLEVFSYQK